MKKILTLAALSAVFCGSVFAQASAPAAAAKPATVTAVCKDGTPFSGETLKGACRGHGGVNKKASAAGAAPAAAAVPAAAATTKPAAAAAPAATMAEAPGGGADKVWVNDESKVYHCPGDKYYGKTKKGEYMTEAAAKAAGAHADHGKACAAK